MTPAMRRSLYWLPGPLIAVGLVAFAVVFNVLAGLGFLCMVGAAAFMLVAPLLQFLLLATDIFRGEYAAACGTALGVITFVLLGLIITGMFNFT
jgi:hypothetical protein